MSLLVDRAVDAAGLSGVIAARSAGVIGNDAAVQLREADLLALGALADRVRCEEVGDEVRIYSPPPEREQAPAIIFPTGDLELTGLELLREVAIARLTGPRGARVRVDWTRCGLELAQVALGFGANELAGHIASKRGLPIAEGELAGVGKRSRLLPAHVVKRKELSGFVRRAGRTPVFVLLDGSLESIDESVRTNADHDAVSPEAG
jgi:2-iminoacetate synthase ThiH